MTAIHRTAIVESGAELADDVEVGAYSVVGMHVKVGAGTRIHPHVVIEGWTTIGAGCRLFPFAAIGTQCQDLKYAGEQTFVEIGDRTTIREYVTVNAGTRDEPLTRVGSDCLLMANSHVAHGCRVGNRVIMANSAALGGHVLVEDGAILGGILGVHQFTRIGTLCMVGGMTRVSQDCPPYMMVAGNPAEVHGLNSVGLKRNGVSEQAQRLLKNAYRVLYRENLTVRQAIESLRAADETCPEVEHLLSFFETSERGVAR